MMGPSGLRSSPRRKPRRAAKTPRIALALAGGGPLGASYEIGAVCALEDSLDGLDFTQLDHYVGVSAGGFMAAALANGIGPREICAMFIESSADHPEFFDPAWLMVPAYHEYVRRAIMLPAMLASAAWRASWGGKTWMQALERLGPSLPTGLFSNQEIDRRLARVFTKPGRSNDFRELKRQLTLVATNLDTGEATPFGRPGWDHVPISRAVQASSALPGLFPPVEIDENYYVDGALKKTLHASVALDQGVDLMLCINPLVPFNASQVHRGDASMPVRLGGRIPKIVDGGLPAVLSQTFRAMIHSRMELGMRHYETAYPNTDIVLVEPDHRDPELYHANVFSYSQRQHLAEHAFEQTRAWLRSNRTQLSATFARHGISLRQDRLDDPHRHLLKAKGPAPSRLGRAIQSLEEVIDNLSRLRPAPDLDGRRAWP